MSEPKGLVPVTADSHEILLPLFTFGTLLAEQFMVDMLGRPVMSESARLNDFRVESLAAFDYPVLVPAEGETVDGHLYRDLGPADFRRVDAYQGVDEGLYVRVAVNVTAADRPGPEPACVYLPTERTMTRGRAP